MKRTISILLAIIIILTSCIGAYATNNETQANEKSYSESLMSDSFVNTCNSIFESSNTFVVKNKNGEDISAKFYNDNLGKYNNNDLQAIWEYANENVSSIGITTESININSLDSREGTILRAPYEHKTITNEMMYWAETNNTHKALIVNLRITGTFYYNGNTYEITNYNTPVLTTIYPSDGTMCNTSVQAAISADHSSITFTGSTDIKYTYQANFGSVTDYAGPFVIAVTGTP